MEPRRCLVEQKIKSSTCGVAPYDNIAAGGHASVHIKTTAILAVRLGMYLGGNSVSDKHAFRYENGF